MVDIWLGIWFIIVIASLAFIAVIATIVLTSPFPDESIHFSIRLSNAHIWVSPNGTSSVAGLVVENTGEEALSIDQISIRAKSIPYPSWYHNSDPSIVTPIDIKREITYDGSLDAIEVTGDGSPEPFIRASGSIPLQPGEATFLYLANPAGISAVDVGSTFVMNLRAGKASASTSISVLSGEAMQE